MKELDPKYHQQLQEIVQQIQASEELKKYLDEEEEEDFQALRDLFEPKIATIYEEVALNNPLQLVSFERALLVPEFEGLFLPKLLGYAVLRGEVTPNYKYARPQNHFKDILLAICNSSNFDYLKKRIGQTIQIGFFLSSDIWITNLINSIDNKRIRYFLQGQKLSKFRDAKERRIGYLRYKNQFKTDNYHTAQFPKTTSELKVLFSSLKLFVEHRVNTNADNTSIMDAMKEFLENKEFQGTKEHVELMALYINFFEMEDLDKAGIAQILNKLRKEQDGFVDMWLDTTHDILESDLSIDGKADSNVSFVLDNNIDDELNRYYNLMDVIHGKGYVHEDAIEATKVFYNQNEGLSTINDNLRLTLFNYFARFINNIGVTDYNDYFDLTKIFPVYMDIFSNQQFNQNIKDLSMRYVKKLLKKYTDKRGKDYQDIKKFVSTTFQDLGFLKEKEVVELFKTRRKKKKPVQ